MNEEKLFTIKIPSGATLSALAKQYSSSVDELAKINAIPDPRKFRPEHL